MNILDENVPEDQRALLRGWRISVRHIGRDVGRMGMQDDEIIPLLHGLDEPTLFTLDSDFYDRRLCHSRYCLVHMAIDEEMAAEFVRRVLRHPALNTRAKRLGLVIRASASGLTLWRAHERQESHLLWERSRRTE